MKLGDNDRTLIAFLAILITLGLMSKVSGGVNIAIVTPMLTILGALAQNFRKSVIAEKDKP